jgi:V-type H+-transporting ATPase subunit d
MSDLIFFNVQDGYAEAILRGFRKSFLTQHNYELLRTSKDLKELKGFLMDTDYAEFLKEYNEQDTTSLKICLKRKLADEIDYIQANSGPELQKFIQIIRHKYMIDNVINIIEGSKNRTNKEIINSRAEPLGFLPEISGLINLDEVRKLDELYEDVLIDTEVGYYFSKFLDEIIASTDLKNMAMIQNYLQELKPEKIKNSLKKIWLEYFYSYCKTLNSTTSEVMVDLLNFEADSQAIQIVYNSLAYDFGPLQEGERRKVIPNFGKNNFNV